MDAFAKLRRTIGHQDLLFAAGLVLLLAVLVLPMPSWLVDLGLATSITLSVLILMVAIWIDRPLDFSVFPTVLLVATLLRLALNLATTRLILANGHKGLDAAGGVIRLTPRTVVKLRHLSLTISPLPPDEVEYRSHDERIR